MASSEQHDSILVTAELLPDVVIVRVMCSLGVETAARAATVRRCTLTLA